ncbi:MAG: hypothetical protein KC561_18085, partial [Myxococcales bacterium]|nr:hypothetical protein [Myxococcales bacterium]
EGTLPPGRAETTPRGARVIQRAFSGHASLSAEWASDESLTLSFRLGDGERARQTDLALDLALYDGGHLLPCKLRAEETSDGVNLVWNDGTVAISCTGDWFAPQCEVTGCALLARLTAAPFAGEEVRLQIDSIGTSETP